MRYFISVLLLTALIVGWQRPAIAQHEVSGTVGDAGTDFWLGWPHGAAKKAVIKIPGSAIGTEYPWQLTPNQANITISLVTESAELRDHPPRFQAYEQGTNKRVFAPIVRISADEPLTIPETHPDSISIAMCVQYRNTPPPALRVARPRPGWNSKTDPGTEALEIWPRFPTPLSDADAEVLCSLRCRPAPPNAGLNCANHPHPWPMSSTSFLSQLFAGSPFSPTQLYALPEPEGGLGGKGGSGSPFAAVEH
jgi:hypothetical protein